MKRDDFRKFYEDIDSTPTTEDYTKKWQKGQCKGRVNTEIALRKPDRNFTIKSK